MKQTNFLKSFFLLFALIVGSSSVWADDVIYSETFGTTGDKTEVSSYSGFSSTLITPTSSGWKISDTSTSTCSITGSSGSCNAYCGSTSDLIFNFGNKLSNYTNVKLSFNYNKGSGNGKANSLKLYISSDGGSSYGSDILPSNTGASNTWYAVTNITIPAAALSNLCIKFSTSSNTNRLDDIKITGVEAVPAYNITAQSNNNSYGTVSLSGSVITGSPNSGYRYADPAYTVKTGTATVSQEGNAFTVTPSTDCTVQINFEAIPTYTVTFNAKGGTTSATETIGGAGVTLPSATIELYGWTFAGWAAASQTSTQNRPILYLAGETYHPTDNVTLYAVYSLDGIDGTKYQRVTELSQATSASSMIFVDNVNSKVFKYNGDNVTYDAAPEEINGQITPSDGIVWTLDGNNTDGYNVKTTSLETNRYVGFNTPAESTDNANIQTYLSNTLSNGLWKFVQSKKGSDLFTLRNNTEKTSGKVGSLRFNSSGSRWQAYYLAASGFDNNDNTALKLYIPVKTVYNSNPAAAIIQPTVTFEKGNTTLYLDGTTTYTNAASVTGVAKSVTGYKSSNESVATVDASGVVTAVGGIGTATITAYLDIELGVHKAAEASYEVTVKNTTTIAGLKTIDNNSGVVFAADLTDAVVTYVSGDYAYIQDASAAILVNKSGHGLIKGQKINGAVSGTVKTSYSIDQLTAIDLSAATVTEDGVIPAAAVKTLAEIKAGDYDGKLVTVNGATVKTGMDNATSGGVITDDDNVTTFNIIAPNKLTLNATEEGNFTAFVSIYGGSTYRLNIYEASQFVKTRNVATAQPLAFTEDAIELDEETTAFAEFKGQAVEGALGTVTYAITGDAIGTVNAETGVVTLNGACGTATITATAAAKEVTVAGVTTPYTETEESYIVTVNPRYTVTFSANGQETEVRQESYGAPVTIPTIAPVGNYEVQGWLDEKIDTHTDTKPVGLIEESTYTPTNDITLYAVYAKQTIVPDVEQTSTFTFKGSAVSSPYENNEATWTFTSVTFGNQNYGLQSQSIMLTPSANVTSVEEITIKKSNTWGQKVTLTMTDASSNQIFQIKDGNFTSSLYTKDITSNQSSSYTFTSSGNAWIEYITLTYLAPALAYADYRTSLTNATVTMTIGPAGFNTWHQPFAAKFIADGDNGKAYYAADVDANQVVNFQQFSENKIPANTGAIIKGEVNAEVSYIILDADVDFSAENLLHGTNTTETITADDDYYYFISGRTKVSEDPLTYEYGFFVPKSLETGSTFTNNANKAYLQVLKTMFGGATSKGLGMSWTDAETNGITNVNSTYTDGHYYNLAGQRVSENYKGVIIYNGKKIIKK